MAHFVRRGISLGLATVVVVAGLAVWGTSQGYPARQPRLLLGAAWLSSTKVGQLALLDGSSAEVSGRVRVADSGHAIDVVQQGTSGYAINRTAGTVLRVDGATFQPSQPESVVPDARDGLTAFAARDTLYVLDAGRGVLVTADPHTLAARGNPLRIAGTGAASLDDTGRLWLIDGSTGDLTSVTDQKRVTRPGITGAGASALTIAGGEPVIVNPASRTAVAVDPDTGTPNATLRLDLRPGDSVRAGGSFRAKRLYLAVSRGLLIVCQLSSARCDDVIPLTEGSDLGAPVEAGNRLFVPDYATGRVWVIDSSSYDIVAKPIVISPHRTFQLLDRDGVVFFNDPDSEHAGVIRLDGTVAGIAKYDPTNPSKGLENPAPTEWPPTRQTPVSSPTATPPPTSDPTASAPASPTGSTPPTEPTQPTPPTQPTTTTPVVPPPALRITMSRTGPSIGETITLRVGNAAGSPPTAAHWDFGDGQQGDALTITHQWTTARTYQVTVQATLADGDRASTSLTLRVAPMPAPVLTSPPDQTQFATHPTTVSLTWQRVPGAAHYEVEVSCSCPGKRFIDVSASGTATSFAFTWVDHPGCNFDERNWRVTPVAADGTRGPTSDHWFRYEPRKPPVQLSPADGTVISTIPRTTTLTWQGDPVYVAYRIQIDCFGCTTPDQWTEWRSATMKDDTTSYTFDFTGPFLVRWLVSGYADIPPGPGPSPWREIRYTM